MTSLRVIVVDDEPLARDYLVAILSGFEDVEVVAQCCNGREAVKAVHLYQPDMMFLDIEMPGMSGFDVVKALQSDVLPLVVFATAFEAYAVEAFDVQAVDYVLKPFEPERVERAIKRAKNSYPGDVHGDKRALMAAMGKISGMAEQAEPSPVKKEQNKLAVKESGVTLLLSFDEIDWIDAAGDYMCVHVGSKTHVLRCTMKALEQKLTASSLTRVHRSTLVNLDRVRSITSLPKGECQLHLEVDVDLKVSRKYRKNVEHLLV